MDSWRRRCGQRRRSCPSWPSTTRLVSTGLVAARCAAVCACAHALPWPGVGARGVYRPHSCAAVARARAAHRGRRVVCAPRHIVSLARAQPRLIHMCDHECNECVRVCGCAPRDAPCVLARVPSAHTCLLGGVRCTRQLMLCPQRRAATRTPHARGRGRARDHMQAHATPWCCAVFWSVGRVVAAAPCAAPGSPAHTAHTAHSTPRHAPMHA